MQHINIFYLLVTALIGMTSLGSVVAEYIRSKKVFLRSYACFYAAFTLVVVSELLFSYMSINLPQLSIAVDVLHYLNVFVAKYVLMLTFPIFIHDLLSILEARTRNFVFLGLTAAVLIEDHITFFLLQLDKATIIDNLENLLLILIIFYGFVTTLSEYKHCEPDRACLAKRLLIVLGLLIPAIIVDALFHDTLPIILYPIFYCVFSIGFTPHLIQYAAAQSRAKISTPHAKTQANDIPGEAENLLTETLYQQYNISLRERDLLPLLVHGASNQQIADVLCISLNTVKVHIRNIYAKFDVKNRYELFAFLKHGDKALIPRGEGSNRD